MTLNDLEWQWLFHDKMRFWPALLESERLNVRNSTTSAILRYSVHFTIYMYLYLYSYNRETARQLRMYAQLTRCFSAVAELLVLYAFTFTRFRDIAAFVLQHATFSHPTSSLPKISPCSHGIGSMAFGLQRAKVLG